ncbi:MAG: response regulator [Xanthomonadales bacterium]|nr:response regulator [Gammaproteobacteria bacterium]MBT8053258.1 response regulator [Gammaproteobacteria bacterium]NND56047.1 response regulator [Xanthomonadales bacterium]NNK50298.1 response regulator [Xanthomonadales bacterium]
MDACDIRSSCRKKRVNKINTAPDKIRILVVDDHDASCRHAVSVLRGSAGSVRLASTAKIALKLAFSWYPQVICMDLQLPDLEGTDTIRLIRTRWPAGIRSPRVIILTGDESGLNQKLLKSLVIDRVLVKPVPGPVLRAAVFSSPGNQIMEPSGTEDLQELKHLFRSELKQRLPELDHCVSGMVRSEVAAILHQLIASAALSSESRLETSLRAMAAVCRQDFCATDLAAAYYTLLESAHEFLCRQPHESTGQ